MRKLQLQQQLRRHHQQQPQQLRHQQLYFVIVVVGVKNILEIFVRRDVLIVFPYKLIKNIKV
jgi:hypothetical protein